MAVIHRLLSSAVGHVGSYVSVSIAAGGSSGEPKWTEFHLSLNKDSLNNGGKYYISSTERRSVRVQNFGCRQRWRYGRKTAARM